MKEEKKQRRSGMLRGMVEEVRSRILLKGEPNSIEVGVLVLIESVRKRWLELAETVAEKMMMGIEPIFIVEHREGQLVVG